jgi:hypothetical protein
LAGRAVGSHVGHATVRNDAPALRTGSSSDASFEPDWLIPESTVAG